VLPSGHEIKRFQPPGHLGRQLTREPLGGGVHVSKILLGIAVGIAAAVLAAVAFETVFTGPELSVRVSAPTSAFVGEPFKVVLLLSNPHSEVVTLDSVDIDDEALQELRVVAVVPEASPESPVGGFGYQTWYFEDAMPPASEKAIEFEFVADSPGPHQIPFDVCNSYQDCSRTPISLIVADSSP